MLYHNDPALDDNKKQPSDVDPDSVSDNEICMSGLQVTYLSNSEDTGDAHTAVVSQERDGPSQNTRAARQQRLLTTVEMVGSCPSVKQDVSRTYLLQFLVYMAVAVLNGETGDLLEYRHLIQRPKHKKDWGHSFGNKIGRLAQGMPGRNTGTNSMEYLKTVGRTSQVAESCAA